MALPQPEYLAGRREGQRLACAGITPVEFVDRFCGALPMSVDEQLLGVAALYHGKLPHLLPSERSQVQELLLTGRPGPNRLRILPFMMPKDSGVEALDDVVENPEGPVELPLYETAAGKLLTRQAFLEDLRQSGRALKTPQGHWLFPIVDISGEALAPARDSDSVVIAPLELLTMLHKVLPALRGQTAQPHARYTANERVFQVELNSLSPNSTYRPSILRIIGLEWDGKTQQLEIGNNMPAIGDNDTAMLLPPLFTERQRRPQLVI